MNMRSQLKLEFKANVPPPVVRNLRDWHGFSAERVQLVSNDRYEFKNSGESYYLALHDIVLREGELRVDGLPPLHQRNLRGTVTFVPKGCSTEGWCQPVDRPNSFVAMYFDPKAVVEDLGDRYAKRNPPPFAYSRDLNLRLTLGKLSDVLESPEPDDLHAESICLLAALEVFGVLADPGGRLSDRQVHGVIDYVEGHLGEAISLADLAAVAGLSRFHFSRAFKASTGDSPNTFVQKRRIQRACQMLATSSFSVDEIAALVGFKGATQFRRVFRELMGMSPTQYQRSRT